MKVLVGVPSGGSISEGSAKASWLASLRHDYDRVASCNSGGNFNNLWMQALNCRGKITHFAMVHADLSVLEEEPGIRWLDVLIEEMEKSGCSFISTPMAIKDHRGVTSCGIGDPDNRWHPFKRFTVKELAALPVTFSAAQAGYPDKYLLHNNALCVWDMRNPVWYDPDKYGSNKFVFNFTEDLRLVDGHWERFQDSEDWAYSKLLWEHGVETRICSRVATLHHGSISWPNRGDHGLYQNGDEDTAGNWRHELQKVT